MSAAKHIAVWPKVKVNVGDKREVVVRGELVPDGVSAVELENLVSFGAIQGVSGVPEADEAEDGDDTPAKKTAAKKTAAKPDA